MASTCPQDHEAVLRTLAFMEFPSVNLYAITMTLLQNQSALSGTIIQNAYVLRRPLNTDLIDKIN